MKVFSIRDYQWNRLIRGIIYKDDCDYSKELSMFKNKLYAMKRLAWKGRVSTRPVVTDQMVEFHVWSYYVKRCLKYHMTVSEIAEKTNKDIDFINTFI